MNIVIVGLSHKTASLETREKVSFAGDGIDASYKRIKLCSDIDECMILSTCNRVELYGTGSDIESVETALKNLLYATHDIKPSEIDRYIYVKKGFEAVRHIFRVAAGLDSMVIGENQIVQQLRTACDTAVSIGAAGPKIRSLVADSLHAGARARSLTGVSKGVTSVPGAAVRMVRELPDAENKKIVVVGAGKIGRITIGKLADIPVKKIVVMNRDISRAQEAGQRHNVAVREFSALAEELKDADVVVAATASEKYIIDAPMIERAVSDPGREMICIDLGVPRNIDESARSIKGVKLFNIDDLKPVVEEVIRNRHVEAKKAETVILAEAEARYAGYVSDEALSVTCGR